MIPGIGTNQEIEFVSTKDTTEPKTVFILKNLPARYKEKFAFEAGSSVQSGTKNVSVSLVDVSLAGIKEIRSGDQKITEITESVIDSLPFEVIAEVAKKLIEMAFVGEQERKN